MTPCPNSSVIGKSKSMIMSCRYLFYSRERCARSVCDDFHRRPLTVTCSISENSVAVIPAPGIYITVIADSISAVNTSGYGSNIMEIRSSALLAAEDAHRQISVRIGSVTQTSAVVMTPGVNISVLCEGVNAYVTDGKLFYVLQEAR